MRNVLWIILFFISRTSFGQSGIDDYKKMVDSAIIIQTTLPVFSSGKGNVYLIDQSNEPYILLSDKDQLKFKTISIYSKENRSIIKKGIKAWKVVPMLNKNKLTVHIVDFAITYKNKKYNFSNGGGAEVIFEYSCDQDKWVLVKSSWSGI
jgi:hypothetical protein